LSEIKKMFYLKKCQEGFLGPWSNGKIILCPREENLHHPGLGPISVPVIYTSDPIAETHFLPFAKKKFKRANFNSENTNFCAV
jgi:hypothetical protein